MPINKFLTCCMCQVQIWGLCVVHGQGRRKHFPCGAALMWKEGPRVVTEKWVNGDTLNKHYTLYIFEPDNIARATFGTRHPPERFGQEVSSVHCLRAS